MQLAFSLMRSGDLNGHGLGGSDHRVERRDGDGDLTLLARQYTGVELGADQVLVSADGGFSVDAASPARTGPYHGSSRC